MKLGFYQTSFNKKRNRTKVGYCEIGEETYKPKYYLGRCRFEDADGVIWTPTHDGQVSFEYLRYPKADSGIQMEPNSDTATRGAETSAAHTGAWPVVAVSHLLRKAQGRLNRGIQTKTIHTPPATTDRISQESQRPLLSSPPSNPTSEAGRLTWEQVQSKGDGGTNYPQADMRPWGGTDDGSELE